MKKVIAANFIVCMLIFLFSGCKARPADYEVKSVELSVYIADPIGYEVTTVASDGALIYYDFTSYYYNSGFSYKFSSDTLPPEGEYKMTESKLTQEEWDDLISAINNNRFMELPESLDESGITDAESVYITVVTNEGSHTSGGYAAIYGNDKNNQKFNNIYEKIIKCRD